MEVGDAWEDLWNPLEMRGRAVALAGGLLQSWDETGGILFEGAEGEVTACS